MVSCFVCVCVCLYTCVLRTTHTHTHTRAHTYMHAHAIRLRTRRPRKYKNTLQCFGSGTNRCQTLTSLLVRTSPRLLLVRPSHSPRLLQLLRSPADPLLPSRSLGLVPLCCAAQIERGESKIKRRQEVQEYLDRKVAQYKLPLQQLRMQYGGSRGKNFTEEEDRFLVRAPVSHTHVYRFKGLLTVSHTHIHTRAPSSWPLLVQFALVFGCRVWGAQVCGLQRIGFDADNVYEELRRQVGFGIVVRGGGRNICACPCVLI